jgi:hypothetical protein
MDKAVLYISEGQKGIHYDPLQSTHGEICKL